MPAGCGQKSQVTGHSTGGLCNDCGIQGRETVHLAAQSLLQSHWCIVSHKEDVPGKVTWGQAMLLGLPGGEVPTYSVGDKMSQKAFQAGCH